MKIKKILLIAVIALLILTIIWLLFINKSNKVAPATQEPESSVTKSVILLRTDKLYELLLPEQYTAVKNGISAFIIDKIDSKAQKATLLTTELNTNGSIQLSVMVDESSKIFDALVDRPDYNSINISVPQYNYIQHTTSIYGNNAD